MGITTYWGEGVHSIEAEAENPSPRGHEGDRLNSAGVVNWVSRKYPTHQQNVCHDGPVHGQQCLPNEDEDLGPGEWNT